MMRTYRWCPVIRPAAVAAWASIVLLAAGTAVAQTAVVPAPWPLGGSNLQRTSESPFIASQTGALDFVAGLRAEGIAVGNDAIYVAGNGLVSYRFDGSIRWSLAGIVTGVPTIGANGLVYFGDENGRIGAVDPQVAEANASVWDRSTDETCLVWKTQTGGQSHGSPLFLPQEELLVTGTTDGILHAFDVATGARRWTFVTKQTDAVSDPAYHDGRIYVGSDDNNLYALNATTGKVIWQLGLSEDVNGGPAVGPDGTLYVTTSSWRLVAVAANGKRKWTVSLAQVRNPTGFCLSPPAIDRAVGTVYVGGFDGLYAYGYDGKLKWRFASGRVWARPAIGADGTVYVHSYGDGFAYGVRRQGGKLWDRWTGNVWHAHPAIGSDGTVYIGGEGMYAFRDGGIGRPTASYLRCSTSQVEQGGLVGLRTMGRAGNAPLASVAFYMDIPDPNSIVTTGVLDEGDLQLNADPLTPGTTFDVDTSSFPPGDYTFFGRLTDERGCQSNVVAYTIKVLPPPVE